MPDPTEGCLGPDVLGYNLAGDYESYLPAQHATSPAIDCSGSIETRLRFCRWLGVEPHVYDKASVSISTNGTDWTTLWQNPATIADWEWMEIEYDISDYADNQPTVYLRWTMGPTDGCMHYCGWNIDNVRVVSMFCQTWICGDADASGIVEISDAVYLINYIFVPESPAPIPYESGDVDCSGVVEISDAVYIINYVFILDSPAPCDPDGDGEPDC